MDRSTKGILLALGSYLMWGFLPIFWKLLDTISPVEVLFHRMVWGCLFMLIFVAVKRNNLLPYLKQPKVMLGLFLSGLLISLNWGTYIYTVNTGHVLETSLGYFMNPIMTIVAGMVFFKEKLTRTQAVATGIAFVGVAISIIAYGQVPFLGLTLAVTFMLYASVKKYLGLPATEAFTIETILMSFVALAGLAYMSAHGTCSFFSGPTLADKLKISALLMMSGVVTAVPLLMLNTATNMTKFSNIGFTQYVSPSIGFLLGYFVYHETLTAPEIICFVFIWVGIALIVAESIVRHQISKKVKLPE